MERDLYSLSKHPEGRQAIEQHFFGSVDDKAAKAFGRVRSGEISSLTNDERCDIARLLLSLDGRRPSIISKLKSEGSAQLKSGLDNDEEIISLMAEHGIEGTPSEFFEKEADQTLEDAALLIVQNVVDNPEVGGKLVNAHWGMANVASGGVSLVLADRPLIRTHGYEHPHVVWALPITPWHLLIAANDLADLRRILNASPKTLAKKTNVSSLQQAERYVFSITDKHMPLFQKYLPSTINMSASNQPNR